MRSLRRPRDLAETLRPSFAPGTTAGDPEMGGRGGTTKYSRARLTLSIQFVGIRGARVVELRREPSSSASSVTRAYAGGVLCGRSYDVMWRRYVDARVGVGWWTGAGGGDMAPLPREEDGWC